MAYYPQVASRGFKIAFNGVKLTEFYEYRLQIYLNWLGKILEGGTMKKIDFLKIYIKNNLILNKNTKFWHANLLVNKLVLIYMIYMDIFK